MPLLWPLNVVLFAEELSATEQDRQQWLLNGVSHGMELDLTSVEAIQATSVSTRNQPQTVPGPENLGSILSSQQVFSAHATEASQCGKGAPHQACNPAPCCSAPAETAPEYSES